MYEYAVQGKEKSTFKRRTKTQQKPDMVGDARLQRPAWPGLCAIQRYVRKIYIADKEYSLAEAKRELSETYGLVPAQINCFFELKESAYLRFISWEDLYLQIAGEPSGFYTMGDVAVSHGYRIQDYKAPADVTGKNTAKISGFNAMLDDIAREKAVGGPFTVEIIVGDLEGYGDITAGAKLARELKKFYSTHDLWTGVKVHLTILKMIHLEEQIPTANTRRPTRRVQVEDPAGGKAKKRARPKLIWIEQEIGKSPKEELAEKKVRIESLVNGIISGTGVQWLDLNPESPVGLKVEVGYPAHNTGAKDMTIHQYGYQQFGNGQGMDYGSGPGYGTLGVILPDEEQVRGAIDQAAGPVAPNSKIDLLRNFILKYGIQDIHFAYYSIYQETYKKFASEIANGISRNTLIIFSKYGGDLKAIAQSMNSKKMLSVYQADIDGGLSQKQLVTAQGPSVYIVNFAKGVSNEEMLALYYMSTGAVGATGDQSFIEAYTMRRRKKSASPTDSGDILYDAPGQQIDLYTQIKELEAQSYAKGKETMGLKKVTLSDPISHAFDVKPLVYPVAMLVNQKLLEKGALPHSLETLW